MLKRLALSLSLLLTPTAYADAQDMCCCTEGYQIPGRSDVVEMAASPWRMWGQTTQTTDTGEGRIITFPQSELMSWERYQPGVLRIGQGQNGFYHSTVETLQMDARQKLAWLLAGRAVMKLEVHRTLNRELLHLSHVADVYFGNTNRRDVNLVFQGAPRGEATHTMTIRGQSANALRGQAVITGGDLLVRAGDAAGWPGEDATVDPGELVIGGGRVGGETRGNVAIGDAPSDWADAEGTVWIDDAPTPPAFATSGGGFLFSSGGALYWQGSAGTVTQIAAP